MYSFITNIVADHYEAIPVQTVALKYGLAPTMVWTILKLGRKNSTQST